MNTTPLPPLAKSTTEQADLFYHLYEYGVSAEGVHQRLEKVCKAYATQARADLEAENARLREALQVLVDNGGIGPEWMFDDARAALEKQP